MAPDLSLLPVLEHSLWRAETRFDRALMECLFAPDFFEFGRSGRRHTRQELLFDRQDGQNIDAILHDLALRPLSADLAQVTCQSGLRTPQGTEWANRSSIWDRASGRWLLRFHQGTPLPERLTP